MPAMSSSCFVCGKPSVLYYDYLVVEEYHEFERKGKLTTHKSQKSIRGILRITVCGDCLIEQIHTFLANNTKPDGTPKFSSKKEVQIIQNKLTEMKNGYFERFDEVTQYMYCNIFFAPFHQFEWENPKKDLIVGEMTLGISEQVCLNYMSDEEHLTLNERNMPKLMSWAKKHKYKNAPTIEDYSPRFKRLVKREIESPYVLWTSDAPAAAPFTQDIRPVINTGNPYVQSEYSCIPMGRIKDSMTISDRLENQAMLIEAYYFQNIMNI